MNFFRSVPATVVLALSVLLLLGSRGTCQPITVTSMTSTVFTSVNSTSTIPASTAPRPTAPRAEDPLVCARLEEVAKLVPVDDQARVQLALAHCYERLGKTVLAMDHYRIAADLEAVARNKSSSTDGAVVRESFGEKVAVGVVGGVIVAALTFLGGWIWGKSRSRKKFKQVVDSAAKRYAAELEKLIEKGAREGKSRAVVNGRAIVQMRDAMRKALMTIASQLNSEIDRMKGTLDDHPSDTSQQQEANVAGRLHKSMETLRVEWPARKVIIEVEVRKVINELGLDPE